MRPAALVLALPLARPRRRLRAVAWWRSHNVGAVQRGARLAAERGCLSCHGPAGRLADPDGHARASAASPRSSTTT